MLFRVSLVCVTVKHPTGGTKKSKLLLEHKDQNTQNIKYQKRNAQIKHRESQAQVKKLINIKRNESWERNCNKMNKYFGGTQSTERWSTKTKFNASREKSYSKIHGDIKVHHSAFKM